MFKIKEKLFAHLETWRLYTVIWCGLVSLAGSCIAFGGFPSLKIAFLAAVVPMMGWTAGLYLQDFLDRKLDLIEKPHRPIPSGRIKPKEALAIGGIFVITGLIFSLMLNINNFLLAFLVAFLVFTYAKYTKSRGLLGNLNRGAVTVVAYIFGVFSVTQSIQSIPIYIWLLSLVFFIHDTNSNLVGAIRDMKGDKKGGYMTFPAKHGIKKTILVSGILTFLYLSLLILLPLIFNVFKIEYFYVLSAVIMIILALYIYMIKSLKNYSREKALKYHEFFIIERITLASALIYAVVNNYIATIIYFLAFIITHISQHLLRSRYEFEVED